MLRTVLWLHVKKSIDTRDEFMERRALVHLIFLAPHAGETYLAVCLKSVKVCPSYV